MGVLTRLGKMFVPDTTKRDAALEALSFAAQQRMGTTGTHVSVTQETALRHSAVWAGLRLRANLVSSLPVDGFRKVGDIQVEVPLPPFFDEPSGPGSMFDEWLWASQFDLDRYGCTVGIVTEVDGNGRPRSIDLVSAGTVTARGNGWRVEEYKIGQQTYAPAQVYIEHQYRPAGFAFGLCPIAYAAWSIGGYLSAQKFGLDYFGTNAMPSGVLKNTALELADPAVTQAIKDRFKQATANRDIFVTGKDWEWSPAAAPEAAQAFLEQQRAGVVEVARYLDVPADMIDGAVSGQNVTYANISQRNVQLLVTSIGPAVQRRERRLSRLLASPRFVKLNTDALLRMDPETRERVLNEGIRAFRYTVSEARALGNRPPLTEADYVEFDRLGLTKQKADPAPTGASA